MPTSTLLCLAAISIACGPTRGNDGDDGDNPAQPDASTACANVEVKADLVLRPIDIVIVVDTSSTMGPAVAQVEAEINGSFTSIIQAAGIDYRVILLSSGVTIGPPLSTSGRFFSYDIATGSGNAYSVIGSTVGTWSGSLRTDAFKVFLWFTDSSSGEGSGTGQQFDSVLLGDPAHFGTAAARNYRLHSIIGMAANNPVTSPWLPTQPVVGSTCIGGFPTGPGPGFQELSIATGGLRFPVCQYPHFNSVFQTLASSVITGAALPCVFDLPAPPSGQGLDLNSIELVFSSSTMTQTFTQVAGAAQCTPNAFFVDGNQIRLCPQACSQVSSDPNGKVDIRFDCQSTVL
jgi:hypothetical protein